MSYFSRTCGVCNGTGYLWQTSFETGGDSPGANQLDFTDASHQPAQPHTDQLPCWQCLGTGWVTDGSNQPIASGETSLDAQPQIETTKDWATNDGIQEGVRD